MKRIKRNKKYKVIDFNKQILWAFVSMLMVIGGALGISNIREVKALDQPAHQKSIQNNNDGTYTIALNVTGKSVVDVDATKANVVIVLDTSGSMAEVANTAGATKATGQTIGRFGRVDNDDGTTDYYRLYYRYNEGTYMRPRYVYYAEGTGPESNQRHGTVCRYTNVDTCSNFNGDRYNFTDNSTRLDQTKVAVKNAITTLLNQNNNGYNIDDMVEISLITFSSDAHYVSPTSATGTGWTKGTDGTSLKNAVDAITAAGGTNWDEALQYARSLATAKKTAENKTQPDNTYIIFFSDGNPTMHNGTASYSNGTLSHNHSASLDESNGNTTSDSDKYAAYYEANQVHSVGYNLYSIFAYGPDEGKTYMKELTSWGNYGDVSHASSVEGNTYFAASSQTEINAAFASIVSAISNDVGVANVQMSDGTTAGVEASSGSVHGTLLGVDKSSYKYYLSFPINGTTLESGVPYITNITLKSGNTYTLTAADGTEYDVERVPAYNVNSKGQVLTSDDEINNNIFKFEWKDANNPFHQINPPAATYNTAKESVDWDISNLDNGDEKDDVLLNNVTYTVTFDVYPNQVTLDIIADLQNKVITYGDPAYGNVWNYINEDYTLKTNTTATLKYDDTESNETNKQIPYTNPDPVSNSTIDVLTITKKWENGLDTIDEDSIRLYVDRDKDASRYHVDLTDDTTPEWTGTVKASIGIMIVKDGKVTLLAQGHDYKFAEDQDLSYKWELTSPTIRPMMINGGIKSLLLIDSSEVTCDMGTKDYCKDSETNKEYYKLTVKENEGTANETTVTKYYEVGEDSAALTATNKRRSVIDITKKVTGADAPADATFNFKINVDDANGDEIWFSVHDANEIPIFDLVTSAQKQGNKELDITDEDIKIVGIEGDILTYTYKDQINRVKIIETLANGNYIYDPGYYYAENAKDFTATLKANWTLRIINLPTETSYTVEELIDEENLANGFAFRKVNDQTNSPKYTGEITKANAVYNVEYTNEYELTHIDVEKIWTDKEDQDAIRPEDITVILKRNGENYKEIKLDGSVDYVEGSTTEVVRHGEIAKWKARFNDLPVYTDGTGTTKYTYEVTEKIEGVIAVN